MIFNRHANSPGDRDEETLQSQVAAHEHADEQAIGRTARSNVTMPQVQQPHADAAATRVTTSAPSVRLRGLRAFYGSRERIKGIDLDLEPNRVTAIIGPSGCGKSTMI